MLMNRVSPRRPPSPGEATGGFPGSQPSASQPELSAGVAPFGDQEPDAPSELGATMGGSDFGPMPMPPMPPPPPGSNLPLALEGGAGGGAMQPPADSRSMMGGGVPQGGTDLFGGGQAQPADPAFLQQILAGLPGGRR